MTRDDIISMAREAAIYTDNFMASAVVGVAQLERFAALVAAKERERFALECIDLVAFHGGSVEIEAAIRARGAA